MAERDVANQALDELLGGEYGRSPIRLGHRGRVLCEAIAASCVCLLDTAHGGPHECECGGSWKGADATGDFEVVAWPQGLAPSSIGDAR